MRPKSILLDLPSTHDIVTHLHNEFVCWIGKPKVAIKVLSIFMVQNITDVPVKMEGGPGFSRCNFRLLDS